MASTRSATGEGRLPDFFLAGVPKAGTTSLYRYLREHPQIFLSPVKEPAFFAAAELRSWQSRSMRAAVRRNEGAMRAFLGDRSRQPPMDALALDWEAYLQLFRDAGNAVAVGEGSAAYSWAPGAPAAIHARVPAARLIFVLRDPAERFHSHYLASLWSDPGAALRDRLSMALAGEEPWAQSLAAGCYATNLARFLSLFDRRQLHIVWYEELQSDPVAALRGIFAFLGVDPDVRVNVSARENVPILPRFRALHAVRRRLLGPRSLTAFLPASIRAAARSAYRESSRRPSMASDDRRALVQYYRDEIARTARLFSRDLSAWMRDT